MQDWAAHLKYLQSILLEFDADGAPKEGTMIIYFRKGIRPSIWAEMEQRGRELDSFKEFVEKAVNTKAKAALRPRSYARETDQYCPRSSQPASSTTGKAQDQGSSMKDPRVEEPKSKPQEPKLSALQQQTEASEKARKKKKKKGRRYGRDHQEGSTPATRVNAAQPGEPKKKNDNKNCSDRTARDLSQVKCYNCQKMGHYCRRCPEPKN